MPSRPRCGRGHIRTRTEGSSKFVAIRTTQVRRNHTGNRSYLQEIICRRQSQLLLEASPAFKSAPILEKAVIEERAQESGCVWSSAKPLAGKSASTNRTPRDGSGIDSFCARIENQHHPPAYCGLRTGSSMSFWPSLGLCE